VCQHEDSILEAVVTEATAVGFVNAVSIATTPGVAQQGEETIADVDASGLWPGKGRH
jgi:hypothetical protein